MIRKKNSWKVLLLAALMLAALCGMQISVQASSGDNSLSTLGILTEGVEVSPEFYYSTIEYNVTVPAGTAKLELDPVPSNSNARIVEITGQELVDGETTVEILVEAENGNRYTYYLYVEEDASSAPAAVETEAETEPPTEAETEPETEDPRYVRVDRNSLQEAENTISALKAETSNYRDRLDILMKILYGLIGFCVFLLFVVINLTLKKKDLKTELQKYMGYGYPQENEQMQQGGYAQQSYGAQGGYDQSYGAQNGYDQSYDAQGGYDQSYGAQGGYDQSYDAQNGYDQSYDTQGGYEQNYDAQSGYDQSFEQQEQAPEVNAKAAKKEKKKRRSDDPNTVPKPTKARKAEKPKPEYQKPAKPANYQPNEKASENVEINMIDL